MVACFAPGCKSGYGGGKAHLFKPSPEVTASWIQILSKLRSDKVFNPAIRTHRLCHLHFKESDVVKADQFVVDGKDVYLERIHWKLKPEAVPSLFPNIPKYLQPKQNEQRRVIKRRILENNNDRSYKMQKVHSTHETNIFLDTMAQTPQINWWTHWTPENGFSIVEDASSEEYISVLQIQYLKMVPIIKRSLTVRPHVSRGFKTWNTHVESCDVTNLMTTVNPDLKTEVNNKEDASSVLSALNSIHKCAGISGFQDIDSVSSAIKLDRKWVSKACKSFGTDVICQQCKILHNVLRNRFYRTVKKRTRPNKKKINVAYYKKRAATLRLERTAARLESKKLRIYLDNFERFKVEKLIESIAIPKNMKTALLQSLQIAKRKSARGARYPTDWLMECLLLRIKSPAAYNHLKAANILPLPHPGTLRKLISGQKCEYGFSDVAFNSIQQEFSKRGKRDRQGVLIFDEVQCRETMEFNKQQRSFTGFVDYGDNKDVVLDEEMGKRANHALVLMYRPFNDSWVQPIAAFATRNAAKGHVLKKLILTAILKLEEIGAEVLCVVCDGSKPNKSFWNLMGINGYTSEVTNKITHPADDTRFLYFASDVPHLFKCIRNHFRKNGEAQFQGKKISFKYYERLFKADKDRLNGLRKCPKLSASHIWPNSFEKMIVSLATQLFSHSVATGFNFYRNLKYGDFYGSEATEDFTQTMNDVFDCLNGRLKKDGITPQSKGFHKLAAFSSVLTVEMERQTAQKGKKLDIPSFASKETIAALRVTVQSTLEIVNYLVDHLGFGYVLTAKLNQDCLEKFFGLIRASGGREDHPTIANFIQLYRLLTIYTPVKRALRGNIDEEEDVSVLCKFENYLRASLKEQQTKQKEKHDEHSEAIMERLVNWEYDIFENEDMGNPQFSEADESIVYYLGGFLCYKARKLVKCTDCITSLCSTGDHCPNVSRLVDMMNRGPLHYPSKAFHEFLFNAVELNIVPLMKDAHLYGDIVLQCIRAVSGRSTDGIGCVAKNHGFELLTILIPYYITMRLHFYARAIKKDLGRGKATKNKRKESKLIS